MKSKLTELPIKWCNGRYLLHRGPYSVLKGQGSKDKRSQPLQYGAVFTEDDSASMRLSYVFPLVNTAYTKQYAVFSGGRY